MKKNWFQLIKDIALAVLAFFTPTQGERRIPKPTGIQKDLLITNITQNSMVTNKLGVAGLVVVLSNALKLYRDFKNALKDGIQPQDAIVLWTSFPLAKEVYLYGEQAYKELLDLKADESQEAVKQIAANVGESEDVVITKIVNVLDLSARTHLFVDSTYRNGKVLLEEWQKEFGRQAA